MLDWELQDSHDSEVRGGLRDVVEEEYMTEIMNRCNFKMYVNFKISIHLFHRGFAGELLYIYLPSIVHKVIMT